MRKIIFFLFGAPGSGKGYLGDCIKQELVKSGKATEADIRYVSTGDLLREEIASGSELGQELSEIVNSGKLVSDEIVNTLVVKAFDGSEAFLFVDGYPRTRNQFNALRDILSNRKFIVISIKRDTPVELIRERVSKRRVCEKCKCTHSVDDGCCPKCGGKSVVRKDDAIIDNRLNEYYRNTEALWYDFYKISKATISIDGCRDAENAAKDIVSIC